MNIWNIFEFTVFMLKLKSYIFDQLLQQFTQQLRPQLYFIMPDFNSLQYLEVFENQQLQLYASSISPRLADIYKGISRCMLIFLNKNGVDSNFQLHLDKEIVKLTYSKVIQEGPFCSKHITDKYYKCLDCSLMEEKDITHSFCKECFSFNHHQNHNFRLIKTNRAICDCGNTQALKCSSICDKHKMFNANEFDSRINEVEEIQFIKEQQFLLYLFFRIRKIQGTFVDDHKKKEIYAICVLKPIIQFAKHSYQNQMIASAMLRSDYPQQYTEIKVKGSNPTVLRLLFQTVSYNSFSQLLATFLLEMFSIQKMRVQIIKQYLFKQCSQNSFMGIVNPLSEISFQYFSCSNLILQMLKNKQLPHLTIKYKFDDYLEKGGAYIRLYANYNMMLTSIKGKQIAELLVLSINISDLSNYTSHKQQKIYKDKLFSLEIQYFKVIVKIIKHVITRKNKQELLKKIIRQSYKTINQRRNLISLSAERTLALAFFAYYEGSLQKCLQQSEQSLLQLMGESNDEDFIANLQVMLKKSMIIIKLDNYTQYKKMIVTQIQNNLGKILLSFDQIFIRILINIIMKIEQPSRRIFSLSPFMSFLQVRQKSLSVLLDLFKVQQMSKMQQTMNILFFQICLGINNFIFSCENSFHQVIAGDYLGYNNKDQVLDFFQLLNYLYDTKSFKQFKTIAQKIINNETLIQEYLKKSYILHKKLFKEGKVLQNKFNLSYNSLYFAQTTFKQNNLMYLLKLNSCRRSQTSTIVFSYDTIDKICQIFMKSFKTYNVDFKQNDVNATKVVMQAALETLIILHLQTKDERVRNVIQFIRKQRIMDNILNDYYKQLMKMYADNDAVFGENKKKKIGFDQVMLNFKKQQAKDKIKNKMNQLKQKQSTFLQTIKSADELQSNNDEQVIKNHTCIICKQSKSTQRLNYLCTIKFSNAMMLTMLNSSEPIAKTMTCGHSVHKTCLTTHNLHSQQQQFQCFLCKQSYNILVPIVPCPQKMSKSEYQQNILNLKSELEQLPVNIKNFIKADAQYNQSIAIIYKMVVYQLFLFSNNFTKYFVTRMFPVIRQFIKMLQVYRAYDSSPGKHPNQSIFQEAQKKYMKSKNKNIKKDKFTIIKYIANILEMVIINEGPIQQLIQVISGFDKDGKKSNPLIADYLLIDAIFQEILEQKQNSLAIITAKKQYVVDYSTKLYNLPADLLALNKQIGICYKCKAYTSKMLICLICSFKTCEDCKKDVEDHTKSHLNGTVFIKVEKGTCLYKQIGDSILVESIYQNYVGDTIASQLNFPKKNQFLLSKSRKMKIMQNILNDEIDQIVENSHIHQQCQTQ